MKQDLLIQLNYTLKALGVLKGINWGPKVTYWAFRKERPHTYKKWPCTPNRSYTPPLRKEEGLCNREEPENLFQKRDNKQTNNQNPNFANSGQRRTTMNQTMKISKYSFSSIVFTTCFMRMYNKRNSSQSMTFKLISSKSIKNNVLAFQIFGKRNGPIKRSNPISSFPVQFRPEVNQS